MILSYYRIPPHTTLVVHTTPPPKPLRFFATETRSSDDEKNGFAYAGLCKRVCYIVFLVLSLCSKPNSRGELDGQKSKVWYARANPEPEHRAVLIHTAQGEKTRVKESVSVWVNVRCAAAPHYRKYLSPPWISMYVQENARSSFVRRYVEREFFF